MPRQESITYGQLLWKQTGFGARDFELRTKDGLVAVLYWPKFLSQRAVAECNAGKWAIDRIGFFRRRTVVTELDSGTEVANFEANWLGDGAVRLANGRTFHWYRTKCLGDAWALASESGHVVLEIDVGMRRFKYEAEVVLCVPPDALPDRWLLILMTWYLGFMRMQDTAAAVAVTAAVC